MELSPGFAKVLFSVSAVLGVIFALMMVSRRNPVYSALYLILFFMTVAVDFLLL